jgi:hypothetical protein
MLINFSVEPRITTPIGSKINLAMAVVLQNQSVMWLNPAELPNIWLDIIEDRYCPKQIASWIQDSSEPLDKSRMVFYTRHNLTFCTVSTEYVDSLVECTRTTQDTDLACAVHKMRRTPEFMDKRNSAAINSKYARYLLKDIPYTLPSLHLFQASVLENQIRNLSTIFDSQSLFSSPEWFAEVPVDVFSNRLTTVLNTKILATLNTTIVVGVDATQDKNWGNIIGTWTKPTTPMYHINKTWISLYFVSASVSMTCAVINVVLRSLIHTLNFFGSISAMTRDSPFSNVPTTASGMDGTERSGLLQDKWIMTHDVSPDNSVGRIAFSDSVGAVALQGTRMHS